MARISLDDSLGRDPRLDHLAELCGWTRRETAGCLQLDVWPLCYDRITPNVPPDDINRMANRGAPTPVLVEGGFAAALIKCGLARKSTQGDLVYRWERDDGQTVDLEWPDQTWRGRIYIKGSAERIAYRLKKKASGKVGGKRSAVSRTTTQALLEAPLEQCSSTQPTSANPSASASASAVATANTDPATADAGPSDCLDDVKEKTVRAVKDRASRVPDRAWRAADYLRDRILTDDPNALVHREPWGDHVRTGWRLKWADEIRLMVTRDGRTYEQIFEVLRYVFTEQTGEARFIVQSADALREKWDRIQAVRRGNTSSKSGQRILQIPIARGGQS